MIGSLDLWRRARGPFGVAALCLILSAGGASAQCRPQRDRALSTQASAGGVTAGGPAIGISAKVAADIPAWKTLVLGTYRNGMTIRDALDEARCAVGDSADEILGRPAFTVSAAHTNVDLVVVSVSELGFGDAGASIATIYARATALGLDLCPAEVGPLLRLQYADQPLGEFLRVAMRPIATYAGTPVDFTLANGGADLALIGGEWRPDLVVPGAARFVFARPPEAVRTAKK